MYQCKNKSHYTTLSQVTKDRNGNRSHCYGINWTGVSNLKSLRSTVLMEEANWGGLTVPNEEKSQRLPKRISEGYQHRGREPTEGFPFCHQLMPWAAPAALHQHDQEDPHPRQSWQCWKKVQNTSSLNKTRSNFQVLFFWFGPPQLYLCSLLMTSGWIHKHMSFNLMNSKSNSSLLVVVSYCLPRLTKKPRGKVMQ